MSIERHSNVQADGLELILNAFTLIKETSSRLEKDKIVKGLIKDKKVKALLIEILTYVFHPYWNYWVKVKSYEGWERDRHFGDHQWKHLRAILDNLRNRRITGDEARDTIEHFLENDCSPISVGWFAQIVNRDIKIGYQLRSWEKMLGEFVPKFSPMLAATWDRENLDMEVIIEPKLDGIRCFAIFPKDGEPTTVSRNGRPIYNTEKILDEMQTSLEHVGLIFDGELIGAGENWGSGISAAHTKVKKISGLTFAVFDMLTLKEWEERKSYKTLEERRERLKACLLESKHVKILEPIVEGQFSKKQIKSIKEKVIKKGGEGIVIKPLHMRYMFQRCNSWLKDKFKDNVDCRVVGRIEGNHKNKGKLGALIVEGKIGKEKFKSEVGQGFSDKDRKRFWKMQEKELKRLVVEIEHYGLTDLLRLKKSDKLPAVRNGVFLRVREDKMER